MARYTRQDISIATGFDQGATFTNDHEVRVYFTVENLAAMMGHDADYATQDELDAMAAEVIYHCWHYDPDACEREGGRCPHCGHPAQLYTCERCGKSAWLIDCGHYDQPRPIAADDHHTYCEQCHEAQKDAD